MYGEAAMEELRKIKKFYTAIIMDHIGLFLFVGFMSVIFGSCGWFPNEKIYAITQILYEIILPALIAFHAGRKLGGETGGVQAVIAVSGVLAADPSIGLFSAMLLGPAAGYLWKQEEKLLRRYAPSSLQMLMKNLCVGIAGGILAILGMYVVTPFLEEVTLLLYHGVDFLAEHQMLAVVSIFIEPAKVFFLNNMINHSVLIPLGIGQAQELGKSILFLLETNPGPGIGVLAAICLMKRKQRNDCAAALFAHAIGGIHEVYFPFVLSNLWLLIPLIAGGAAGTYWFAFTDAGLQGMVSPGSLIVILVMAGQGNMLPVLSGICISAAVSFIGSLAVLKLQQKPLSEHPKAQKEAAHIHTTTSQETYMQPEEKKIEKQISRIAFVCDGGVGSSAMGAALFRRALAKEGISGIQVEAFAADLVPPEIDLLVCQKDFYRLLPQQLKGYDVYTVENLIHTEEYTQLIERLSLSKNAIR